MDFCTGKPALLYRVNQMHIDIFGVYRWSWFNESMGYQHFGLFSIGKTTLWVNSSLLRGIVEKTVDGPGNNPD